MCLIAYVTDIFGKLNELNKSMQGKNKNLMHMSDRIDGFRGKICILAKKHFKGKHRPFTQLSQFLKDNSIDKCSTKEMCSHLKRLEEHLATHFRDVDVSKFDWVRDPFPCDAGAVHLPATAFEQLIEQLIKLFYDRTQQGLHSRVTAEEFWLGARDGYPEISLCALKHIRV